MDKRDRAEDRAISSTPTIAIAFGNSSLYYHDELAASTAPSSRRACWQKLLTARRGPGSWTHGAPGLFVQLSGASPGLPPGRRSVWGQLRHWPPAFRHASVVTPAIRQGAACSTPIPLLVSTEAMDFPFCAGFTAASMSLATHSDPGERFHTPPPPFCRTYRNEPCVGLNCNPIDCSGSSSKRSWIPPASNVAHSAFCLRMRAG